MEGFWTVQFSGVQGFGSGSVILIGGHIFGGDSAFLYTGTYRAEGSNFTADVQVNKFAPGMPSVMGQDRFSLALKGALNGNVIAVTGSIPGTPLQFRGNLTKQAELPR